MGGIGEQAAAAELSRLRNKDTGRVLAIDPGTKDTGWAVLDGQGRILDMGVIRVPAKLPIEARLREMCVLVSEKAQEWVPMVQTIVVEWQAIRPGDKRPNDILHLAVVLGAVLSTMATGLRIFTPTPVEWKGSVPGEIFTKRVTERWKGKFESFLADVPASFRHNALDALGLAEWARARI